HSAAHIRHLHSFPTRRSSDLMNEEQKQALFNNTAAAMGDALDFIKHRHIRNCYKCDPAYGEGVAKALGMTVADALAARDSDPALDRKSTRLNSSHVSISYAVF